MIDREYAERQRAHLRKAADRIERGESLDGLNAEFLAVALRAFADMIPDEPKKRKGRQPSKLNPVWAVLKYASLVRGKGMSKTEAIGLVAELAEVDADTVKKALKKQGHALKFFINKTKSRI